MPQIGSTWWRVPLLSLALISALPAAMRAGQDIAELSGAPGWYRMHSGETVLVTFASDGNLMVFHFGEQPFADRLKRSGAETLVWSRGEGKPEREVRFSPGAAGGRELRWREGTGQWHSASPIGGPYAVIERSFRNGGITLSGTILVPSKPGPHPGVVFIHGSGASTRDNAWYMRIADRLARNGIAVLLPDKRGSGKSGGKWEVASFDDLARDAAAGVSALRSIESVAADRVGVLGVSQGGHVVPMVPRVVPELAFLVNLSGSAVPIEDQLELELTNTLRQEGWPGFMIPVVRPIAVRVVKRRQPVWWEKNGAVDPIATGGSWRSPRWSSTARRTSRTTCRWREASNACARCRRPAAGKRSTSSSIATAGTRSTHREPVGSARISWPLWWHGSRPRREDRETCAVVVVFALLAPAVLFTQRLFNTKSFVIR